MKRYWIILLAMLLLASWCMPAVVAKSSEKSVVSQFELTIGNPDGTIGSGKMTFNAKAEWYVFNGKGLTPGQAYRLTINGESLVTGTADPEGKLHLEGACTAPVRTVTVTPVTAKKQADLLVTSCGYASRTTDYTVVYLDLQGYLRGPDGEPIPGATLEVYLSDKSTLLMDDGGSTCTVTTGPDGSWDTGYIYVSHYGWRWYPSPGSEVVNHVFLHFAGDGQYTEAWSYMNL